MGICAIADTEEEKVRKNGLNSEKMKQNPKSKEGVLRFNTGNQIVEVNSQASNNWQALLKKVIIQIDPEVFKWKLNLLNALSIVPSVDSRSFNSSMFLKLFAECRANEKHFDPTVPLEEVKNKKSVTQCYKKILLHIEEQLLRSDHPFRILHQAFSEYMLKEYGLDDDAQIPWGYNARLTEDIREVIQALCFATIYFYNFDLELTPSNADLFISPITGLIISDSTREIVWNYIRKEMNPDYKILLRQLQKFKLIKLENLNVSPYFLFDTKFREKKRVIKSQTEVFPLEGETFLKKATSEMQKIHLENSPSRKLSRLKKFSKTLITLFDEFWKDTGVDSEKLAVDPDSLLSYFIFCIIKADYGEVIFDHRFMETFITEQDRKSKKGYNLITLEVAFRWIIETNASSIIPKEINLTRSIRQAERFSLHSSIFTQGDRGFISRIITGEKEKVRQKTSGEFLPIKSTLFKKISEESEKASENQ